MYYVKKVPGGSNIVVCTYIYMYIYNIHCTLSIVYCLLSIVHLQVDLELRSDRSWNPRNFVCVTRYNTLLRHRLLRHRGRHRHLHLINNSQLIHNNYSLLLLVKPTSYPYYPLLPPTLQLLPPLLSTHTSKPNTKSYYQLVLHTWYFPYYLLLLKLTTQIMLLKYITMKFGENSIVSSCKFADIKYVLIIITI